MPKLTEARALRHKLPPPGEQEFLWCSEVKGFAARLTSGSRSYIVQPHYQGRKPRLTLGPVGVTPFIGTPAAPGARDLALIALNAARQGEDPWEAIGRRRSPELTVAQLWGAYKDAGYPRLKGTGHKRPSTIRQDVYRYERYIGPKLGGRAVATLDTAATRRWLDRIPGRGQRTQCLILLTSLLSFARTRGLAPVNKIDIRVDKSREVQSFLSPSELRALRAACDVLIAEQPERMAGFVALQVLIDTGARLSEILSALRANFNPEEATLRLTSTKNSEDGRTLLLSPAAVAALASLPVTSSPYLFPSRSTSGHTVTLQKHARAAFARAGVRRVRIHDLRHSFASAAVANGTSLFITGELLGHRDLASTRRYAHLEQATMRAALARVHTAINGKDAG
jgi:integrase